MCDRFASPRSAKTARSRTGSRRSRMARIASESSLSVPGTGETTPSTLTAGATLSRK